MSKLTNRSSIYSFVFLRIWKSWFSQIFWKLNKKRTPLFSFGSSCFSWWNCSVLEHQNWKAEWGQPLWKRAGVKLSQERSKQTVMSVKCEIREKRKSGRKYQKTQIKVKKIRSNCRWEQFITFRWSLNVRNQNEMIAYFQCARQVKTDK